ncbi:MAG TPA: hypothetical protein VEQ41_01690 [Solirubrobacterales bacterium]|nr:hypothetical protein [Solirubrobacterales bacterium]
MKRKLTILTALACTAALLTSSQASAEFGFAPVNTGEPGVPDMPVFPGDRMLWAGTCDLSSSSTSNGGVGPSNGGAEPPTVRPHCMDTGYQGAVTRGSGIPWPAGKEPSWRLDPVTQAGAHPDATASFFFTQVEPEGPPWLDGTVKNIVAKLPPGVVGNPEVLPKCPAIAAQAVPPLCPAPSQAGISSIALYTTQPTLDTQPVYAAEARDTVTAEFLVGNIAALFNVPVTARGRTNGDYGVDTLALLIPNYAPLFGQTITLWGVPWAAEHDKWRIEPGSYFSPEKQWIPLAGVGPQDAQSYDPGDPAWQDSEGNPLPIRPFFTNPTECAPTPPSVSVEADSWEEPVSAGGTFISATTVAELVTDCDELSFDPSITLKPTVKVADSPSGLDVTLSVPQNNDPPQEALGNPNLPFDPSDDTGAPAYWKTPAGRATAHLKDTTVQLPQGTSFNPAAANGVAGCTTAQVGLTALSPKVTFNNDPHRCPDNSKIGTLEIVSPLLPDPLFGSVFAAPQHDNPFPGSLTAIYMVSQDEERGLSIKLPGKVDLDPDTGQIATTFLDNPQLPFDTFELHFKSGARAPLNTPPVCGQFRNQISLIPWSFPHSGPEPAIQDPFDIASMPNGLHCVTEPEDRVFGPGFEAGSTNTQAGAYTNLVLNVTRNDGHQEISAISADMPPGLSANLTETPYCPEHLIEAAKLRSGAEETASPSCPRASQMGTVNALAGAGPLPLPTPGRLYIAGPYDPDGAGPQPRAPFSIVVITPAIAGGTPQSPTFDLGNVVIRSAGYVDPRTAKVTIASTKVPYIVGGVPLRIRRISVNITKPSFMLNPTNCSPMSVGGTLGGAADPLVPGDDVSVGVSNRFQVGGCENLGFKPTLKMRYFGGTRRGAYQRLRATLTARPGDANIARTAVTLPGSSFLAQENIRTLCTRVQFAANACPEGSIYGTATAWTPLLKEPLVGNVYLRSSDNPLPDMVASLKGQFDVELVGRIDSVRLKGGGTGIRSTFDVVPDAPVSKFVLNMFGGKRSLIVNSEHLCAAKRSRASVRMVAQNARKLNVRPKVKTSCRKGRKASRKGDKRRGGKGTGRRARTDRRR